MRFGILYPVVVAAVTLITSSAFAESHGGVGDAEKGAKVFKKCKTCHQVGDGAKNKSGPILNGVIGRTAGTNEGFKYSKYMIAAGEAGLVWNEAVIATYLENPKTFLREFLDNKKAKSKMTLKVKKEADRADVAAYVGTFSDPVVEETEETEETTATE